MEEVSLSLKQDHEIQDTFSRYQWLDALEKVTRPFSSFA